MLLRHKHIRQRVETVLAENHVEFPQVPVERIAAAYGIDVRCQPIDGDVSGFLARRVGDAKAIIGVNKTQSPNRRRFSVAHELGHFFLHSAQGKLEVHVDRSSKFQIQLRSNTSSQGVDVEEMEANLFAAELLMPARFLEQDLVQYAGVDISENDQVIDKLAKRYGVSKHAMSIRLGYLGWLNIGQF